MMRLTRRERLGLITLLIICALIIGVLALRRSTPVPVAAPVAVPVDSAEIYKSCKSYKTYESRKNKRDSVRKKAPKKPRKAPPALRRHLDEPF
ncbi:MAG: hypothetical protein K2K82_08860 [Muribaculaceae bacterium]|nr:hypothetical protein [Muribaculaceae bacterium]